MIEVSVIHRNERVNDALKNSIFKMRYDVFKTRLAWDVKTSNGLEKDHYDELNPVYLAANDNKNQLQGCWRMLPTNAPYMLQDTFPELSNGEEIPSNKKIWEISRWASAPSSNDSYAQAVASESTFKLIKSAYDFAINNDIDHYVVVTSVAMERLVKQIGLPLRRFSNKKSTRIGKVLSVALWIDINEQFYNIVYPSKAA